MVKPSLAYTQFLIFEIGSKCNLSKKHPKCPVSKRNLSPITTLSDEFIVKLAYQAYKELGFTGFIGWHFYNEPLKYRGRLFPLMEKIRTKIPESRFILWTNGTYLGPEVKEMAYLFDKVVISNYLNRWDKQYLEVFPNAEVCGVHFDDRLEYGSVPIPGNCYRPFVEFIINVEGDVCLCCQDWDNHIKIGNVKNEEFPVVVGKYLDYSIRASKDVVKCHPVCTYCTGRIGGIVPFDPNIAIRTNNFLNNL